ncbi:hypothetical protein [Flavicella sp.]|uniref:hypothetical protein n=1 Tax=Flavicella sp. TaxID=2957742 RepID=UPI003015D285
MRFFLPIVCFFFCSYSQTVAHLEKTIFLETDNFVGCDYDFNIYYFSNTILSKKTEQKVFSYSNFIYGNISSVDITNPLNIVVFYRDFNIVIILDSQLNETDIIQLPYDISFVTKGAVNHIWLLTRNMQTIENYNFRTKTVVSKTQPLTNTVILNMKSTENYVYLHTKSGIQTFDYLGNFIKEHIDKNIDCFQYNNRILYILYKDTLYKVNDSINPIKLTKQLKIENFHIINNHFFIFDGIELYLFSIRKK